MMKTILEKADSGASWHYLKNDDKGVLKDTKPATDQVVNTPNNKVVTSSFKGQTTAFSVLFKTERYAHMFKYTYSTSIISLCKLCDYGFTAIFD